MLVEKNQIPYNLGMVNQLLTPFVKYKYLLSQLILREIKARYKQSIIGYAWIIINPLSQMLVYTFVFSIIFRFTPESNVPYSVFIIPGLLSWIHFQTSITTSSLVLVDNADLLRKVYFPREVFIYSVIIAKSVDLLLASLILFLLLFLYHVNLTFNILLIIPFFILQFILTAGISFITSSLNLFYRDIQYVISLILLIWMYLTPILYPINLVPQEYLWLYKINPMVGIIRGYRSAVFNQPLDTISICWSILLSIIIFILGFMLFKKWEKIFADVV